MKFFTLLLVLLLPVSVLAQEDAEAKKKREEEMRKSGEALRNEKKEGIDTLGWKIGGIATLTFSQIQLYNWAQGGVSSLTLLGVGKAFANYHKGRVIWDTQLETTYGLLKSAKVPFTKSEDRLELISKAGTKAFGDFYYSGLVNFRSQLTPTFTEGVMTSSFMAPAFLLTAIGLEYKPSDTFFAFLSPTSGKFTFVMDQALADSGAFGVEPGQMFRSEFGAYFLMRYKRDLLKNVNLQLELDLFNNYTDPNKSNRKNIDVNWETMLTFKVNDWLMTSISTHLIYDHDIPIPIDKDGDDNIDYKAPRTQFRELFGLGLILKLD